MGGSLEKHRMAWRPFDPRIHESADLGLGGQSTEYIGTFPDPSYPETQRQWNIPTIWWDDSGNPRQMDNQVSNYLARMYEETSGRAFPRYRGPEDAVEAAMQRSSEGGGNVGALAKYSKKFRGM